MNKQRILDLIRSDVITMNGGKNRLKSVMLILIIFCLAIGFLVSPAGGVIYSPLLLGGFFVPMIFANEQKYHSEKMYAMLPIGRTELVRSRFIMTIGLYVITNIIMYLLMLVSLKIELYKVICGGTDPIDIYLEKINSALGGGLSKLGLVNLLFWSCFACGLNLSAGTLRKYFKDGKSIMMSIENGKTLKEFKKRDFLIAAGVVGALVLVMLIISGILPVGTAMALIAAIFMQLAKVMNGVMLSAAVLIMSVFSAVYSYICTLMEYEDKEL